MLPSVATVGYCASQSSAYDPFRVARAPISTLVFRRLFSYARRPRPLYPAAKHIKDPEGVVGPHGSADAITHGGAMSASVG